MTDFADDPKAVKKKRESAKARKQLYDGVIRNIMSTMPGRLWMWQLLSQCHMFEAIAQFDGEGHVQKTYFALGERNVGIRLLADVQRLCPKEYVLAMEENTKFERDQDGRLDSSSPDGGDDPGSTDSGDGDPAN